MIVSLHGEIVSAAGAAADDPVRGLVQTSLQELGESPEQVSIAIGQPAPYLRRFLEGGAPQQLPPAVRRRLAGYLGIAETTLL